MKERVTKTALVDEDDGKSRPLRFDGAGHPGGTCANDCQIHDRFRGGQLLVHLFILLNRIGT